MKFLHDVIYKGSLTAEGNVQLGNSRLDTHSVYGALVVGEGGTGTDITALTVKAMGTGASVNFQTLDVNGVQVFATLENGYILTGGTFRPTDQKTGFTFDAFVISPAAFSLTARANNTGGIYKGLVITEGNLNGISGGSFDTRYVEVTPTFNATAGAEYKVRGFYYNPTITNLAATTVVHTAWENTSGDIIHGNLSGTGTRMVVADANGKLSVQTIPSFSESDTLDSVTDRGATTTNNITTGGITANGVVSITTSTGGLIEFYPEGGSNATYSWMRAKLGSGLAPTLAWYGDAGGSYKGYGIYGPDSTYDGLFIYREAPTLADVILMGASRIALPSTQVFVWSSTTNVVHTPDLGLAREAAGLLQINNGSLNTYASLKLLNLTATGLAGSGTRMVTVDANGLLGAQAIPSGSGSSTLSGLTDVTITSVANNQLLKYDSGTSKWINWTPDYLTSYTEIYQGTVTSVALSTGTSGTDINVSGSPVTGSGTITLNIPNASLTARGVVSTGAQTFTGQKTFHSLTTTFDSSDTGTFIEGKASGVLYGGIAFSLFMQFNAYAAATQGFVWKNGLGNNVMALEQSGVLTVANLAGTGTRMVVANSTGVLSTQSIPTGNAGTVTSVSVASVNGFSGTVATDTTTPVITLSTPITGVIKGTGTGLLAASPGTDYVIPSALNNYLTITAAELIYVPKSRTLTINGETLDLTADRSWTITGSALTINTNAPNRLLTATGGTDVNANAKAEFIDGYGTMYLYANSGFSRGAGIMLDSLALNTSKYSIHAGTDTADGFFLRSYSSFVDVGYWNESRYSVRQSMLIGWANTTTSASDTLDTAFARESAGLVQINDGTRNTYASLKLLNLTATSLAGTGTRMVVADSAGLLSTQAIPSGSSGTVTTVSVVSANGFAGSVANASSTPAITLTTTVTGLLKGNGTGISTAVAGTDYLVSNQTITLSGAVSGSGTTTISTTLANSVVGIANLSATGTPSASTFLRGDNTWATVSAGGGYSVVSVTTTYNATQTSGTVIIKGDTTSAGFSVNLPTAVGNQTLFIIKKSAGSAALIIDGFSTETIDGSTSIELIKVNESVTLVSDNTNWLIV